MVERGEPRVWLRRNRWEPIRPPHPVESRSCCASVYARSRAPFLMGNGAHPPAIAAHARAHFASVLQRAFERLGLSHCKSVAKNPGPVTPRRLPAGVGRTGKESTESMQ